VAPCERCEDVPSSLSAIIMKLLSGACQAL
jgi:hypothetical protein